MKKRKPKQEQKEMKEFAEEAVLNEEIAETPAPEEKPDRVTELEAERDQLKNQLMRTAADFENFRRRNNEDRVQWIRNATERLSLEVCDVLDNFDRALNTPEGAGFIEGVKLIRQQVEALLKKEGVERIDAKGTDFNPMVHEAVAMLPSGEAANRVTEVVQNGYIMNGKVIRAAKVVVSSGTPAQPIDNKEE
jgi:molecular chaperone GrpE